MNYNQSIIGTIFSEVDHLGADLAVHTYQNLVQSLSPIIYIFCGIYLGLIFLLIKRGKISLADLPFMLLKMVCILTLALNYHYFALFVYDVFTQGPLVIAHAITLDGHSASPLSIQDALDEFLRKGMQQANQLFLMGGWNNPTYLLFGIGVFLVTLFSAAIATGMIVLAKIACVIILSLSPLFIFFALFDATQGLFNAYIHQLLTYGLIPIMMCAILMIVLSVTNSTIAYIATTGAKPSFSLLIPFLVSCVAQIWLLLQVPQKCAALASGFHLKGVITTLKEVQSSVISFGGTLTGGQLGRSTLLRATVLGGSALTQGVSLIRQRINRSQQTE